MEGTKVISTREYVSALKELVQQGQETGMVIWGTSMTPFLGHNRDRIFFRTPDRPLRRGDMVFYERDNGMYIMHRIYKVKGDAYYMVGDAQDYVEGPLRRDQIFALITKAERKGKLIGPGSFWWMFFQGPWLWLLPYRRKILRVYGKLRGKYK